MTQLHLNCFAVLINPFLVCFSKIRLRVLLLLFVALHPEIDDPASRDLVYRHRHIKLKRRTLGLELSLFA
jgi:hypothetical protein